MLRLNPQFLSVEDPLRVWKVSGSLGREELEKLWLAGKAGQQGRRQPWLASQRPLSQEEGRGGRDEGFEPLAGCDGALADPAVVAAAAVAVAAPRLLRLGGQLFSVRGLARLHPGGGAEGF